MRIFLLVLRRPSTSTLFPYTSLFRSAVIRGARPSSLSAHSGGFMRTPHRLLLLVAIAILADRKSTRLNSSHGYISYAVFCLKEKLSTCTEWSITRSAVLSG